MGKLLLLLRGQDTKTTTFLILAILKKKRKLNLWRSSYIQVWGLFLGLNQTTQSCFSELRSLSCLLATWKWGFLFVSLWVHKPQWCSAVEMVVFLAGLPFSAQDFCCSARVTIVYLLTFLTKAVLPLLSVVVWSAHSVIHLKMVHLWAFHSKAVPIHVGLRMVPLIVHDSLSCFCNGFFITHFRSRCWGL